MLDNNISRILKITHARFVAVDVYHGSFSKLIEGPPHFEYFEMLVVEGPFSAKVVKILALSSFVNGFNGHSLGL